MAAIVLVSTPKSDSILSETIQWLPLFLHRSQLNFTETYQWLPLIHVLFFQLIGDKNSDSFSVRLSETKKWKLV